MDAITKERWLEAQREEKTMQDRITFDQGLAEWRVSLDKHFRLLGMSYQLTGDKTILEAGCANFSALYLCSGFKKGILVEPLPLANLLRIVAENPVFELISKPLEEVDLPEVDEVWLFNVLQHVIDPDLFLDKCIKAAPVIRFFEPIDWPVCSFHPHTFTLDYFKNYFGDSVQLYKGGSIEDFHEADCAYGTWVKPQAAE